MHELAITENILDIAQKNAKGQRITALNLVIGQLSSIVDDSVQFYWDLVSQGTSAEGAKLHFRRIPTEFECRDCGIRFYPVKDDFSCPKCGSLGLIIAAGEEFFIESIEVTSENTDG